MTRPHSGISECSVWEREHLRGKGVGVLRRTERTEGEMSSDEGRRPLPLLRECGSGESLPLTAHGGNGMARYVPCAILSVA